MIRAILVDFAGTMTEDVSTAFLELSKISGADPRELADMVLSGDDPSAPWCRFERGEISLDEIVEWGRTEGDARGWSLDFGPFVHGVVTIPIRDGIVERLIELRRHGYRTALVTNNAKELAAIWPTMFPVADTFDVVVDSSAVGTRKPERQIFDIALERLGVRADEAVLFDDLELNIIAARALGISGVLVEADPAAAFAEMDRLLGTSPLAAR